MSDADVEQQLFVERIRSLYDSGVPLFSKRVFRDLAPQLELAQSADEASRPITFKIPTIDGRLVEMENRTSWAIPGYKGKQMEDPYIGPFLDYIPIQRMTSSTGSFESRYCSAIVAYGVQWDEIVAEKGPAQKDEPVGDMQMEFEAGVLEWNHSPASRKLRTMLEQASFPHVNKIITFANGSFSSSGSSQHLTRSIGQHALTMTVRDILRDKNKSGEILCYAQDPEYTTADKAVLESNGITVLEDPRAFLEVNESTVVLSFAPNVPVRQIITDIARPAAVIWDRVIDKSAAVEARATDPASSRVREMIRDEYQELTDLEEEVFGNSCIYVRRT